MNKDLLKYCRYYNGEDNCDLNHAKGGSCYSLFWEAEHQFVKYAGTDIEKDRIETYKHYNLTNIKTDLPIALMAQLFDVCAHSFRYYSISFEKVISIFRNHWLEDYLQVPTTIDLVSFFKKKMTTKEREKRVRLITDILNNTHSKFVMFSPQVFRCYEDLEEVGMQLKNKKVSALFEIGLPKMGLEGNVLYLLSNGKIRNLHTHQIFSISKDVNEETVETLINELESHRQFMVDGKRFLVFQCGENNIFASRRETIDPRIELQAIKYKGVFKLKRRPDLEDRFNSLLEHVDVILNPIHTPWSRTHLLKGRFRSFSGNQRHCFCCSQITNNTQLTNTQSDCFFSTIQYAYRDEDRFCRTSIDIDSSQYVTQNYLSQTFEIRRLWNCLELK